MTVKARLLEKINSITDVDKLEAILQYLEESEKNTFELSDYDRASIKKSEEQFANGEFVTNEVLMTNIGKWLGK
jgi:predicted transcriptional regulator